MQVLVSALINVDRQLKLQFVRQLLNELVHILHVLLLLTIYLVLYSRVKVQRQLILFVKLVKDY
jgi:hypothetical protein